MHDPLCVQGGFHHAMLRAVQATWPEVAAALADGTTSRCRSCSCTARTTRSCPCPIARHVAAALPQATLRVFPGDLHDVLNEHDRDIVHEELVAFVDKFATRDADAVA